MTRLRLTFVWILIASACAISGMAQDGAREYTVSQVREWSEDEYLFGSPDGYWYLKGPRQIEVSLPDNTELIRKGLAPNQRFYCSPKGNYWGVAVFDDKSPSVLKINSFTMYSPSGAAIYTLKEPQVLGFVLNDKAPSAVGVAGAEGLSFATLRFYDATGAERGRADITDYMGGQFCADGSLFFASSADSGIYVLNPDATPAYRVNAGRYFAPSADGRLLLSYNRDQVALHSQQNLITSRTLALDIPRVLLVAPDKTLALIVSKSQAVCLKIPELTTLWEYNLNEEREHFSSADFDPDLKLFAFGIALDNGPEFAFNERYTHGRVEVLDLQGQKQGTALIEYESWSRGYPKVLLSGSDHSVDVITHTSLYRLPID